MGYTALYRKWRPPVFEDVKGQDHIVTALKNQIKTGRIGHAYLFCGTRGTGKTTVAKILAKAVNCESPVDGSPCGECASCRAIDSGASMGVVEIDAASNNGVDNIREIKETVQYSPSEGKYRVYIIDEVHMLSAGAFNALLKTLEEPPSYVIFILATTEVHKIPITVLSRCQRYDFRRISGETIAARLKEMAVAEGIDADDDAIRYVAKKGDGSLRDAISLFDQCVAFYYGEHLDFDKVLSALGAVDNEVFSEFYRNIINGDSLACIKQIDKMLLEGRELGQFVSDFTWYLRNILIIKTSGVSNEAVDMSSTDLERLKQDALMTEPEILIRYIRVLSELSNQMRYSGGKRVLLEITVIKLTKPEMEMKLDSVIERLDKVEKKLEQGVVAVVSAKEEPKAAAEPAKPAKEPVKLPKVQFDDLQTIRSNWKRIINQAGLKTKFAFEDVIIEPLAEGELLIITSNETYYGILGRKYELERLSEVVGELFSKSVTFKAKLAEKNYRQNEYVSDDELKNVFNADIMISDDVDEVGFSEELFEEQEPETEAIDKSAPANINSFTEEASEEEDDDDSEEFLEENEME